MKRSLLILTIGLLASPLAFAQLPDGSTAPNWTLSDINGVSHTLYNYLDQDKVVFLDFSATWCGPCWNYHNSGALENLYDQYGPSGTDEVRVFMIEGDAATNVACIYGLPSCVGGTQGDWTAGTPYPIIDDAAESLNGPYNINYFPTIYGICPDRTIYETGQVGTAAQYAFAQSCPPLPPEGEILSATSVDCWGESTGSITITASGLYGPFTYEWSNGATTQNLFNIPTGTYSVTITGTNGGTKELGPVLIDQPPTAVNMALLQSTPTGCNGILGTAEVYADGGTGNISYAWSHGATSPVVYNLTTGTYGVTATDANGCTAALPNIQIEEALMPIAEANAPSNITCTNNDVTLSGDGSTIGSSIIYFWSTANGHIVAGESSMNECLVDQPGNYTLLVTDVLSTCSASATTIVAANTTAPTANAGPAGALNCTTASVTLSGSGSSGSNFSYLWTTVGGNIVSGATTLTPLVNDDGTYTLRVTNSTNGCTSTSSTSVTANTTPPNVSAAGGTLTCSANSVTLNGNSSTGGATFAWTGPNNYSSNQQNPTVSNPGTYTLTVTNPANNCTAAANAEVAQNTTQPNASATGGSITCTNSSVQLAGNSSTGGATFAWTGPNGYTTNQQNPVVNESGNYVLTVTGPNGCTQTAAALVAQNTTPPVANAGANGLLNCNASSVVLNGSGSSSGAQFAYLWTTTNGNIVSGANTLTPTVNAAGNYNLLVTNSSNGCASTAGTAVTQSPAVSAAISSSTNVSCFGGNNGSASVTAGGGNNAYSYAWSNGATTATASSLAAGTYGVTVTDGENCTASQSVQINEPSELVLNTSSTSQSAPGVNDGSATANVSGGVANYTYAWNNGGTTATIDNLSPGEYFVTATDANGCSETQAVTVNIFGCSVQTTTAAQDVTCNGANDGAASISLNNSVEPYTFTWSNGENTQQISDLAPGNYFVTATDGNGCEVVASVEIEEPASLSANATATGETAAGASDGTATANPTGGNGNFTYLWTNGATTQQITSLPSANYTVTVTDANGCTSVQTVPVAPFGCSAVATITATNLSCNGANDGQATATLAGGLSPYVYEWSNEEITATISNLKPGTYTVTISDAVNCPAIAEVTILEPNTLTAQVTAQANADCGETNGMATVTAMGGSAANGYAYNWSNGASGETASNLAPGAYSVSISDDNGCQTQVELEITVDDNQAPVVATQNLIIALDANGTANVTASQVDNGSADNCGIVGMSLDAGSFNCNSIGDHTVTLTVTDVAGNVSSGTATVTVVDQGSPSIVVNDIVVSLDENGEVNLTPAMIDNGSSDNCGIVDRKLDVTTLTCAHLGENAVVLTVTDASGNSNAGTSIVTMVDEKAPVPTCPGDMNLPACDPVAEFSVSATDNCGAATVLQTAGLPSGSAFPVGQTVQTFTFTDASGNTSTCSFSVKRPESLSIATTVDEVLCHGDANGSVSTLVAGGSGSYIYEWSNGANTPSLENVSAGDYSVVVTDQDGCTVAGSVSVSEPAAISTALVNISPEVAGQSNGAIDVTVSGGVEPYEYQWTNASGNVMGTQEDISGLAAGTYTLHVTDANGCVANHAFTIQSVSGTENLDLSNRLRLFPNPTTGRVTLELQGETMQQAGIQIFDLTGKLASSFPQADLSSGKHEMDLRSLSSGVYFVEVVVKGQVIVKRLVIE